MFHSWQMKIDTWLLSALDSLNNVLANNGQEFAISYPTAPIATQGRV
jgi:hypothetical protein